MGRTARLGGYGLTGARGQAMVAAVNAHPSSPPDPLASPALARALIDARALPMAITDANAVPVLTNALWDTAAGAGAGPAALTESAAAMAGAAAGGTASDVLLAQPDPLGPLHRLTVRPVPDTALLLWTVVRSGEDQVVRSGRALLDDVLGSWLGGAGLLLAMTDRGGRTIAANAAFRAAAALPGGGERPLGELLVAGEGTVRAIRRANGELRPARVLQLPLALSGDNLRLTVIFNDGVGDGGSLPEPVARLIANLPLGVCFVDVEAALVHANEALLNTVGHDGAGPLRLETMVVADDCATVQGAVDAVAAGELGVADLRVRLNARPDEAVPLRILPARGLGGLCAALVLPDNREQLRLEQQVAQAVRMQSVGQLAGGIAHDFNNILTAITGYCELIAARGSLPAPDAADVGQIRANADRASALVRQLLAFSRQQLLRPHRLLVSEVVAGVAPLLHRLLGEAVALDFRNGDGRYAVRADPGQLEQVIVNLAINARDAMAGAGTVIITTRDVPARAVAALGQSVMPAVDYAALEVEDTGTGIDPAIMGRIYEPFFTTKAPGSGTGLGLSTVYGIVKQTGGFIFARNRPEGGTAFTVYLPSDSGEEASDPAEATILAEASFAVAAMPVRGATILLVEDEPGVRGVAERTLSSAGYTVLTAVDGDDGLAVWRANRARVDLLLSDVSMPGLEGPELAAAVRAEMPDLPVLLISGYADVDARRTVEAGQLPLLIKPFTIDALRQAVADVLAG